MNFKEALLITILSKKLDYWLLLLIMLFVAIIIGYTVYTNQTNELQAHPEITNVGGPIINICEGMGLAAPIGACGSPLPIIIIAVILATVIWIYTHEPTKEAKA